MPPTANEQLEAILRAVHDQRDELHAHLSSDESVLGQMRDDIRMARNEIAGLQRELASHLARYDSDQSGWQQRWTDRERLDDALASARNSNGKRNGNGVHLPASISLPSGEAQRVLWICAGASLVISAGIAAVSWLLPLIAGLFKGAQ